MYLLPSELAKVVIPILEDLACPRSLTVAILLRYNEGEQLVNLTTDPHVYQKASDYWAANAATELLRKNEDLPLEGDLHRKAVLSFFECEEQCRKANLHLNRFLYNGPFRDHRELRIADFLDDVKKYIKRLVGPAPRLKNGRFGPGATFGDRGRFTTIADKMSNTPCVTADGWIALSELSQSAWGRALREQGLCPTVVRGNRFTTVPKDATKLRGIAIEPSINVFSQLSVGDHLKECLTRAGLPLMRAQLVHGDLARKGSVTGELATIDLSSASDTVCKNLIKLLLPEKWFEVLNGLRSPETFIEGRWVPLEKFSSMGNGFTFELETLIFFAVTFVTMKKLGLHPVVGENISTFGDDIICPTSAYKPVSDVLSYLGFSVNKRKSFSSSYFRESCGRDYFNGSPVRGHYIKSNPRTPQDWIVLANGIRRMGQCADNQLHPSLLRGWLRCIGNIPISIRRLRGPNHLGDSVIHDDDTSRWVIRVKQSEYGSTYCRQIRAYIPVAKRVPLRVFLPPVQLAAALYGIPSSGITPRGAVSGFRFRWLALP